MNSLFVRASYNYRIGVLFFSIWFPLLTLASSLAPPVYPSADVPKTITNGAPTFTSSKLNVPLFGKITDINLINLSITHTYISDVTLYLTSPNGNTVQLLAPICGANQNMTLQFDDVGTAYTSIPCPPTNGGTYKPYRPLSAFNGESAFGEWTLTIVDLFNGDGGTLNSWSLDISTTTLEDCFNSIDDDGDGNIDFDDTDCICTNCSNPLIQEFFVPFPENQVVTTLTTIFPGNTPCGLVGVFSSPPVYSTISINTYLDSTIVVYDHWEDGFELDINAPRQRTTQIWGDLNPHNGIPPGYTVDYIPAGAKILLFKPIDPATMATVDFDGGDYVGTTLPVSLARIAWLNGSQTLFAGTLEATPTLAWGTDYKVPLGQNVFQSSQITEHISVTIMAKEDGTSVQIDKDANSSFETTITLNKGQSYLINGGVLLGARILGSAPIQVHMVAGDVCSHFESRWLTLYPESDWTSSYYTAMSGSTQEILMYNPNTISITIRVRTNAGFLSDVIIPANSATKIPANLTTGYHLFSTNDEKFAAISFNDSSNPDPLQNSGFDWGAFLLPTNQLSKQAFVGYAPGQDPTLPTTENSSPVWYTVARFNNTNSPTPAANIDVCIDYNGDGIGPLNDSFGRGYDVKQSVSELTRNIVYDPDGDQSNMILYICNNQNAVISAFWGEDVTASPGSPGLDMGRAIPPVNPFYANKKYTLLDRCGDGQANVGDTLLYTIRLTNPSLFNTQGFFRFIDNLPSEVEYINNTTVRSINGSISNINDNGFGTPFPLDGLGYFTNQNFEPGEFFEITFKVLITTLPSNYKITNTGSVTNFSSTVTLKVETPVFPKGEICNNNCDDDGDGLADCDDADCSFTVTLNDQTICQGAQATLSPLISNAKTVGKFKLQPKHSNLCLSLSNQTVHFNQSVVQSTCSTNTNQQWNLIPVSASNGTLTNGTYYIQNEKSGLYLFAPTNAGAEVKQGLGTSTAYQWQLTFAASGYQIMNVSSGKALTIPNNNLLNQVAATQETWASTTNQRWNLQTLNPGYTFAWSNAATTQSINVSPTATSNYIVTITNAFGCSSTYSAAVNVEPIPTIFMPPSDTICVGGTVILSPIITSPCLGSTGGGTRSLFNGITGTAISDLMSNANYPNNPTLKQFYTSSIGPQNIGDNYGTLFQGFFKPTLSGNYTFAVYSDDASSLRLSTNQLPSNATEIASVSGWTNPGEITKFSTQQSSTVALQAGQLYYFEFLQKEGTGGDHWGIQWQVPGSSTFAAINANQMVGYEPCNNWNLQWQTSTNGITWNNISGVTSSSFTSPVLATSRYYRIQMTSTSGCIVTGPPYYVHVVADPVVTITANTTNICIGANVILTATTSGGAGNCALQWQVQIGSGAWNNFGNGSSPLQTSPSTNNTNYRAVYTCDKAGCCEPTNN